MVPSAPVRSWAATQRAEVEVGEHVAVEHEEALGDAGVERGEADGAGGVARLGLDGVVEVDAGAAPVGVGGLEGVGPVAQRQHGLGRRRGGRGARPPARSSAGCTTGSICFGVCRVSGRRRVPKPPTSTTARMRRDRA